jgi:hypothetical protein
VNERRNLTLCADNRFFSSSFHGFPEGMTDVAQRLSGRLALNRLITSNRPGQKRVNSSLVRLPVRLAAPKATSAITSSIRPLLRSDRAAGNLRR